MEFNLQVSDEESVSDDKADPEVFSEAPSSVPFPGESETPVEASSSPFPIGALPSDSYKSEAHSTKVARSSPSNI